MLTILKNNYIIQTFGLIGFIFFIASIYSKKKKNVLLYQMIANFLYGIQYLLLNVIITGVLNFVAVLRCFIYSKYENKKIPLSILLIFMITIIVLSLFTIDGILSIIPIMIGLFYTYATWQNNPKVLTKCFLICGTTWIFYNSYVGAYSLVLGNIVEVISSIIVLKSYKK